MPLREGAAFETSGWTCAPVRIRERGPGAPRRDARASREVNMNVARIIVAGLAWTAVVLASPAAAQGRTPARTAPASRVAPPSGPASDLALRLGALVGWERANHQDALSLRVDGEVPIQAVGERLLLRGVGSLGFARFSASAGTFKITTTL